MQHKSLHAFRTIGEISKQLGVESHALRSWEKMFPGVGASKRIGGRRYYTREDYETLLFIATKLREGYATKGVKELLATRNNQQLDVAPQINQALQKKIFALRTSIEELRKRLVLM